MNRLFKRVAITVKEVTVNRLFRNKWRLATVICAVSVLAVLMCPVGVHIEPPLSSSTIEIGQHHATFTLGTEAHAAGVADYTCDGTDDNVQFQQALDALPALGGKLVILAGDYSFSDAVSRAIDDVTIQGVGKASYIARDGVNPVFSAGSQSNWVFRDFSTDAGGITYLTSANYTLENIYIGGTYHAYRSDASADEWEIPVGTKEFFVPITFPHEPLIISGELHTNAATLKLDAANEYCHFSRNVPHDFTSLIHCKVLYMPYCEGAGTFDWTATAGYGAIDELPWPAVTGLATADGVSLPEYDVLLKAVDISDVLLKSGFEIAAGDYVAVKFKLDAITGTSAKIYIFGLVFKYS